MATPRVLVSLALCLPLTTAVWQNEGASAASLPGGECAPRDKYVAFLKENFQEDRVVGGLDSRGALFELFTSKDGETWTLLATWASGISCLVGSGRTWAPVGKPGVPS